MPTGQETTPPHLGHLRPARTSRVSSNRGGLADSQGRHNSVDAHHHCGLAFRKTPTCWKVLGKKSPFRGNGQKRAWHSTCF